MKEQVIDARPQQAPGPVPAQGGAGMVAIDTSQFFVEVGGSIDSVRTEIDDAFLDIKTFYQREPDEIMRYVGGHSARMSELKVKIQRIEDYHRQWKPVRVREIEPLLEELANQFQIASRLHSVREHDWRMETGAR